MHALIKIDRALRSHPLTRADIWSARGRFIRWQIGSRLMRRPVILDWIAGARLIVSPGATGATGNLYCGLLEFESIGFLLHFLRPDDLFVDVGANIGAYTVLAASCVGARTLAFEPVPMAFETLQDQIALNRVSDRALAIRAAVGRVSGEIGFTAGRDTTNRCAVDAAEAEIIVPLMTLDTVAEATGARCLKIDTEGFEAEVLAGAATILSDPALQAVIVEINGSGAAYGHSDLEIDALLREQGFLPFAYDPFERALTSLASPHDTANTLYLRDVANVSERLRTAQRFEVVGQQF